MKIKDILRELLELNKLYPEVEARMDIELFDTTKNKYIAKDFGYDDFNKILQKNPKHPIRK